MGGNERAVRGAALFLRIWRQEIVSGGNSMEARSINDSKRLILELRLENYLRNREQSTGMNRVGFDALIEQTKQELGGLREPRGLISEALSAQASC